MGSIRIKNTIYIGNGAPSFDEIVWIARNGERIYIHQYRKRQKSILVSPIKIRKRGKL